MKRLQTESPSEYQHRLMTETPVSVLVTKLSLPMIVSQLISVIYNTVDTWFVAQINTSAAAAVGVVFALQSIIQATGFALGMGANSLISRRLGEKKDQEANIYGSSAILAGLVFGSLLLVICLPLLKPLMKLLGSSPTILPFACDYAKYILMAAPVMCMSFVMLNVLRAQGKTMLAMWGLSVGAVLNTAFDPLFIFTFKMGISGAALATALSQAVSALVLLLFFASGRSIVKISMGNVSCRPADYLLIITTGLPTVFRQGMGSIATVLLNVAAVPFGDAAVAAMSITNKVYLLIRHLVLGFGQGFQPVAGYNFGAGLLKRVRGAFRFTTFAGTVMCIVFACIVSLFAQEIITFFRNDPDVVRVGKAALYYLCIPLPFMAYSTFVNQMYQCLGFKVGATFLASCRQGVFFIPLVLILPKIIGIAGIEMVQPAADLCTFMISIPFQIAFYRKHLTEKVQE